MPWTETNNDHLYVRFERAAHRLASVLIEFEKLMDIAEELQLLTPQMGEQRVALLIEGLRIVRSRTHTKINLLFHVKSYLATVFA